MACFNLALVEANTAVLLETCMLWPREMWLLESLSNTNPFFYYLLDDSSFSLKTVYPIVQ